MPASMAASTTALVCVSSMRIPKLLQPRPTSDTSSPPIFRFSIPRSLRGLEVGARGDDRVVDRQRSRALSATGGRPPRGSTEAGGSADEEAGPSAERVAHGTEDGTADRRAAEED